MDPFLGIGEPTAGEIMALGEAVELKTAHGGGQNHMNRKVMMME